MTTSSPSPARGRRQARVFKIVNVPMRGILGLPFPTPLSKRLMLAYITGRKTARVYRQPLSYVRDGSTLLTPGGGKWKLNLQPGHPVRIRLGGKDVQAQPEVVSDAQEIQRLYAVMVKSNPAVKRYIPIPKTPDGSLEPSALDNAVKYGFRIVRWHLDESGTPAAGAR